MVRELIALEPPDAMARAEELQRFLGLLCRSDPLPNRSPTTSITDSSPPDLACPIAPSLRLVRARCRSPRCVPRRVTAYAVLSRSISSSRSREALLALVLPIRRMLHVGDHFGLIEAWPGPMRADFWHLAQMLWVRYQLPASVSKLKLWRQSVPLTNQSSKRTAWAADNLQLQRSWRVCPR